MRLVRLLPRQGRGQETVTGLHDRLTRLALIDMTGTLRKLESVALGVLMQVKRRIAWTSKPPLRTYCWARQAHEHMKLSLAHLPTARVQVVLTSSLREGNSAVPIVFQRTDFT